MTKKSSVIIVVLLVVVVVAVFSIYSSGLLSGLFNNKTTVTSTPQQEAPNVVSSTVVSKAFGSSYTLASGASGTSLNVASFVSGSSHTVLSSYNPYYVATPYSYVSPFSLTNVANNATYGYFQIGIFVPPGNGFALINIGSAINASYAGYVVSSLNTELHNSYNGSNNNNVSIHIANGTISGSNYVYVSTYGVIGIKNWYLQGLIANYSDYNILIIYYSPANTSVSAFTQILSSQLSELKSGISGNAPQNLVSASQVSSITGVNFKTQSDISVSLQNTTKLLNEYIEITGGSSSVSNENRTLLNNTIGQISNVYAKYMTNGSNMTELALVKFSSSSADKTLFDAIAVNSSVSEQTYSGWTYINSSSSVPGYNSSLVLAINGNYLMIFELILTKSATNNALVQSILSDESSLI
ncbi:hypothetical protein [Caldiplasma sukawensis]